MRLSFETLCSMTNLVRPKAQAKWFLLHLGVEVPCDRLGPIMTDTAYEKLLERKLGLSASSSSEDKPRPQPVPTRHLAK